VGQPSCTAGSARTITGAVQVVDIPLGGATVTLLRNGEQVGESQLTPESGAFSFAAPTSGTLVLKVVTGQITTYYGPFRPSSQPIVIDTSAGEGIAIPDDGTATAVGYSLSTNGTPDLTSPLRLQIDGYTNLPRGNPAVITGITPNTYPVYLTNLNTQNEAIFPPITLAANTLTIFRSVVTDVTDFTLSGTLTNDGTPEAGVDVTLFGAFPEGGIFRTTDSSGGFSFPNVAPGTHYLFASPTVGISSIYGPININTTPPPPIIFDRAVGAMVGFPTPGNATFVINAIEDGAPTTNQIRLTVAGQTATGASPLVLANVPTPDPTVTVVVTDLTNGRNAVFADLAPDQINEFRAVLQ
jgi:hypothetical protein